MKIELCLLFSILYIFIQPISCLESSCTMWVDSTHGSNENPGTLNLPKKTISGALNSWTSQSNLCSLILQLSPGLYLQDPVEVINMDLEIMRCTICPPFEYSQPNVAIETDDENVLITTSNATLTIRDIDFVSAKPVVKSIILVTSSNLTLLNVSMSNLILSTSLVRSLSSGQILVSNSRFENNTIMISSDNLAAIFYAGLFSPLVKFVSVTCRFNTLIWNPTHPGGICIISSSSFFMSDSIISHNTLKVNPLSRSLPTSNVGGALALFTENGTITVSDSIFEFNSLPTCDPQDPMFLWPSAGAAIFFGTVTTSITISNVTFNSNTAFFGGAVSVIGSKPYQGLNVIENTRFVNNSANLGSALSVQRPGDYWKISNTIFRDNACRWQSILGQFLDTSKLKTGTVSFHLESHAALVAFSACIFERNTVESRDANVAAIAIYIDAELVVSDCQFNHHVTESSHPLITYDWSGRGATIQQNTFYNNSALLMAFLQGTRAISPGSAPLVLFRPFSLPITPRPTRLLISNNRFDLGYLQTEQTTSSIAISLQTDAVVLQENSFAELPVGTSKPIGGNIPLISITQAPKSVEFDSQHFPPMSRFSEVYISGIPTVRIFNSLWNMPLQIRSALEVSLFNVTFSSIFGQAVRLSNNAKVEILDSKFEENVASDSGAALQITNSNVKILQSKFVSNRASRRGAIETDSHLRIESCSFFNNSVLLLGGAIWTSDIAEISDSIFESNYASSGAAIYSAAGRCFLDRVTFFNNHASVSGGAIWAKNLVRAKSSVFTENKAVLGGAIGMVESAVLVTTDCVFYKNNALEESNYDFASISTPSRQSRLESIGSNAQPQDCSGGSIWLLFAEYLEISGCNFTAGQACFGPDVFLVDLPDRLLVSNSSFQRSNGSLTGAISVFPSRDFSIKGTNLTRMIQNCSFSDLGSENGAAVYLEPLPTEKGSIPPLVHMEHCSFQRITGSVVHIKGPLGTYLNWTNSKLEEVHSGTSSVLYFDVSKGRPTQNAEPPPGCIDCEMIQVSEPYLAASVGHPTFICSSHWNISTQFIHLGLTGLYGAVKTPSDFRADVSFATSRPDIVQIFSTENLNEIFLPVIRPVRISLNVSAVFYRDPIFLGPSKQREIEEKAKNQPLFGTYSISLWATRPSQDPGYRSNFTNEVTLTGCGAGSGLQAHPTLDNTFVCQPCVFGTYNVVPSGSCYLCNDAKSSIQKATCFGSSVMSTQGYFINMEGNLMWTYECNYKYCEGSSKVQQCGEDRQGFMCANCVADKTESLMFSLCGSCPDSKSGSYYSHSFVAIGIILMLLLTGGAHWAINKNFPVSLTALFAVQQLLIYPRQYLSTVLPHGLPTALLHWACITPASPLTRASLFAPLMASVLPILSVTGVFVLVLLGTCLKWAYCYLTRRESNSDASQDEPDLFTAAKMSFSVTLRKLLLTSWVFCLMTIVPTLQSIIEFFACEHDPFMGSVWLVAPSVSCNDPIFRHRKNLMLILGTLWLVFMIGVSVLVTIKEWLGLKLQMRHFREPWYTFRVWMMTILVTNLLVGVLTSSSYWNSHIASIGVPVSMMLPAALLVLFKPMSNLFLSSFLMNISFLATLIGLLPISRRSNDELLNEAVQLYLAIVLLALSTIPLFLTEKLLQRLASFCK